LSKVGQPAVAVCWQKLIVPSPGCLGSPGPPHTAALSVVFAGVVSIATHGRLHVNPPLVDRLTQTPFRTVGPV